MKKTNSLIVLAMILGFCSLGQMTGGVVFLLLTNIPENLFYNTLYVSWFDYSNDFNLDAIVFPFFASYHILKVWIYIVSCPAFWYCYCMRSNFDDYFISVWIIYSGWNHHIYKTGRINSKLSIRTRLMLLVSILKLPKFRRQNPWFSCK